MPRGKPRIGRNTEYTGRPHGRPPMVMVTLTRQHNLSGTLYGPGQVRVDENVAATLRSNEENIRRYQEYMSTGHAGVIIATGRGVGLQPVDGDYFDERINSLDPRFSGIRVRG